MRKLFILLFLLFCFAGNAHAQGTQVVTVSADPATCNTGMLYYNSTTNTLKSCGPNNTWGSSSGGITSVTTLPALPCTNGTVVNLTVAPFGIYICVGGTWNIDGSAPAASQIIAANYGAKADIQWANDATITNLSNAIATTGSDVAFVSSDNTKDCFGITGGGPILAHITGKLSMTEGTFTFVSAHAGTCSGTSNANATGGANNRFYWGTNDTAAWLAAVQAATPISGPCKTIYMPGTPTLVTSSFGTNVAQTCGINSIGANEGFSIIGGGSEASVFVIGPNFNFTTECTSNTCLFSAGQGKAFTAFGIWGAERGDCPAAANNKVLLGTANDDHYYQIQLLGWCSSTTGGTANTTGLQSSNSSYGGAFDAIIMDGFGAIGIVSNATSTMALLWSWVGDYVAQDVQVNAGVFSSVSNYFGDCNNGNGNVLISGANTIWQSTGDTVVNFSAVQQIGIKVTSGTANFVNLLDFSTGATGSSGLWISGGTVNASMSLFQGGATGADWFSDTNGKFNNLGGVKFGTGRLAFTTGASQYTGVGAFSGSASGVCTASSTLGFYDLGQFAVLTCTSVITTLGQVAQNSGTVYGVLATSSAAGVGPDTVTVLKNGATQAVTCNMTTTTSCQDSTAAHAFNFVQGDVLSCQVLTAVADTLANPKCVIVANYK